MPKRRIVFALDYPTLQKARDGAERVKDEIGLLKVGLELFVREGPPALAIAGSLGLDVFADLKLCDIPETVDRAIASVACSGAKLVTVHASGGAAMLGRAVERARRENAELTVLAVTALTSLDERDLAAQGIAGTVAEHVMRLARVAWNAGVRGFVCSPAEVAQLRRELGSEAIIVTPGVRPAGTGTHDQKRVASPAEAIRDGADFIVVGRPIRDAADPAAAARAIAAEVASALVGPADMPPRQSV
jgi:orotidine-5'-phosphate decarboxylase